MAVLMLHSMTPSPRTARNPRQSHMNNSKTRKAESTVISVDDQWYPSTCRDFASRPFGPITAIGKKEILTSQPLALFCSIRCPASLIIKMHDLARKLRAAGRSTVSGFHSPVERECLTILLKSASKIILCPARGLETMRIPREYRKAIDEGRMLIVSAFSPKQRQPDLEMTERRNYLVAALADRIFVAHAAPGGKTESLCRHIVECGKPLFTFPDEPNRNLIALGATPLKSDFSPVIPTDSVQEVPFTT